MTIKTSTYCAFAALAIALFSSPFSNLQAQIEAIGGSLNPLPDPASGPIVQDEEFNEIVGVPNLQSSALFSHIDGTGQVIVVIDTGIDLDHPAFGPDDDSDGISDRIIVNLDFADGDANGDDSAGDNDGAADITNVDGANHGSNVTLIAAGNSVNGDDRFRGVAPGADIIALKVAQSSDGDIPNFAIRNALIWVRNNAGLHNIASVNMSLGTTSNHNLATPIGEFSVELQDLATADPNISITVSSGNHYKCFEVGGVGQEGVSYPSSDPNVMSVGATWDVTPTPSFSLTWSTACSAGGTPVKDKLLPISQRSSVMTTVLAPGGFGFGFHTNNLGGFTGTSQAAPVVAGTAALAQQLAEELMGGQRLTQAELITYLQDTADSVTDSNPISGSDTDNNYNLANQDYDNVDNTGKIFPRVNVFSLAAEIARDSGLYYSMPDLRIYQPNNSHPNRNAVWKGDGIINSTASGQKIYRTQTHANTYKIKSKLKNVGNLPERFLLTASPNNNSNRFRVQYWLNNTNVTGAIRTGGKTTDIVQPGELHPGLIEMRVTPINSTTKDRLSTRNYRLDAKVLVDLTQKDRVQANFKVDRR